MSRALERCMRKRVHIVGNVCMPYTDTLDTKDYDMMDAEQDSGDEYNNQVSIRRTRCLYACV